MIWKNIESEAPKELQNEFNEFCELYHKRFLGIAFKYLGNQFDAEDVVNEVLTYVAERYDELDHTSEKAMFVYCCRAIESRAKNANNKRNLERHRIYIPSAYDDDGHPVFPSSPSDVDLEKDIIRAEMAAAVNKELEKLPENYRIAIKLSYFEGLSKVEISKRLSISESAVRQRLEQGEKMLRERMEALGYHGYEKQ